MPKAPKPPPPINVAQTTQQDQSARDYATDRTMAENTIGQHNQFGDLTYTTEIDPITGKPKYVANMQYTPEQQRIFDLLQGNQTGLGLTGQNLITANMDQYGKPIDLSAAEGSLSRAAMDPMMANLQRYMGPQLDQRRTELINQGIPEGSKLFDLEMDKVRNNQGLTMGSQIASFFPQAEQIAKDQLTQPLDLMKSIFGMEQPGNINQALVNTPSVNQGATDVAGLATEAQQEAFRNYQQKVASQNALMSSIMGSGTKILTAPL